jgi:hypothetical protein
VRWNVVSATIQLQIYAQPIGCPNLFYLTSRTKIRLPFPHMASLSNTIIEVCSFIT